MHRPSDDATCQPVQSAPQAAVDAISVPALVLDDRCDAVAVNAGWSQLVAIPVHACLGPVWNQAFRSPALVLDRAQDAKHHPLVEVVRLADDRQVALHAAPMPEDPGKRLLVAVPLSQARPGPDADKTSDADFVTTLSASFNTFIDLFPVAVALSEDTTCSVVRINQTLCRMFGIDRDEDHRYTRPNQVPAFRILRDDQSLAASEMPLHRATRGETVQAELLELLREDGEDLKLLATASPLLDLGGRVHGALAVYIDVTDQDRATQALSRSRDELTRTLAEAQAANTAKDRFIAVLSHELRTPLTPALVTLSGMIDRLRDDQTLDRQDLADELDLVRRSVEFEARLIDDLLDLSRISRGKLHVEPRPTDLADVVNDVVRLLEDAASAKSMAVRVSLGNFAHGVLADPVRIRQAVWNLLRNAISYTPAGGRVDVRTSSRASGWTRLEVSDTGIGIDPDVLPTLFFAFEQADPGQARPKPRDGGSTGLGLGLTISKTIVDLHGGRLTAFSEGPGRGSVFGIELPATALPAEPAPPPAVTRDGGGGGELLLIDDHPDTLRAMQRLLSRLGYTVTTADSVAAVRGVLHDRDGRAFDLIVSDIGLPDGSGYDLLGDVRAAYPDKSIPAVALSGYGMESDINASRRAGFDVHLVKPITLQRLKQVLTELAGSDRT